MLPALLLLLVLSRDALALATPATPARLREPRRTRPGESSGSREDMRCEMTGR